MSKTGGPAPPEAEEIDVGSGGTKLAGQSVNPVEDLTQINPKAIGPIEVVNRVAQFNLVRNVGGLKSTIAGISSITIPFGSTDLTVANVNGSAVWTYGNQVLSGYSNSNSFDWPADMNTPAGIGTNSTVSYVRNGATSNIPFSEFDTMQISIVQS